MANIIAPTIILNKFLKQVNKTSKTQHTVINISSGAAFRAITSWSTYCASKSALKMLNSCVNEEFCDVKSFSISPGIVDTDMQLKIRSANKETFSLVESFKDYHRNGDLETPDNVAKKILYVIENQDIFESNELTLRDITI
jgi:benzil reductase ((S)-benzoin forming)